MKAKIFIPFFLALFLLISFSYGQTTVYCPPSADAVVGSLSPSINFGSATHILVGYDNVNFFPSTYPVGSGRSYIKYDLSSIPLGATITSAKIKLKPGTLYFNTSFPITCYRVDQAWTESTITWSNKPVSAVEVGSGSLLMSDPNSFFINITSLAQEWVSGSKANNGIYLVRSDAATDSVITFYSKENTKYPNNLQQYCLEVIYAASSSYSLTLDVNNVPEGDPTIPGSNGGTVYLYDNSWNQITSKNTDANGVVIFSGLANATYRYRVYISAANGLGTEFWGEGSATISGANLSQTFTRNWPFIEDITIQNASTGATLYWGDTILPGTTLRFNIKVKNPSAQSVAAYPQAILDRNKDLSFDLSSSGSPVTIASGSSNWFAVNVGPVNTAGDFFFGGRANSYYNSAYTLTDTNGYNNTQVFRVVQPTYSLNIDVDNVPEGFVSMPGTYGTVILYDNSWNQLSSQATDAGGGVVFNSLVPATYRYRVYVYGPSGLGSEFWGDGQVTITSSNVTHVHVRNWPFIQDIIIENAATNETLYWGSTVPVGTSLRFKMKVKNPNTGNVSAKVQAILDRNRDSSFDFSVVSGYNTVVSYNWYTWELTLGPMAAAGDYFFGGRCYSQYNSTETLTDTNGYLFSNDQVIHVQTSNTLVFNIYNVSGGDPLVPGNFGQVTLYDTSWNEVTGIVNPQPTVNGVATFTNVPSGSYKYRVHVNSPSGFGSEFWGDGSVTAPQTVPTEHTRNWPYISAKSFEKYTDGTWQEISLGSSVPIYTQLRVKFTITNPNSLNISGIYENSWLDKNQAEPYDYPNLDSSSIQITPGGQVNLFSPAITIDSSGIYYLGAKLFANYDNNSIIVDSSAFIDSNKIIVNETFGNAFLNEVNRNITNVAQKTLLESYNEGNKHLLYFSANFGIDKLIPGSLKFTISFDFDDLAQITQEGMDGWITYWVDLVIDIGKGSNLLPVGAGFTTEKRVNTIDDPTREGEIVLLGGNVGLAEFKIGIFNSNELDPVSLSYEVNSDFASISLLSTTWNLAKGEIQRNVVLDALQNVCGNYQGSTITDFTSFSVMIKDILFFLNKEAGQFTEKLSGSTRGFTSSDSPEIFDENRIGFASARAGIDTDNDGWEDNIVLISPNNEGDPENIYNLSVKFFSDSYQEKDYRVKVTGVPEGWFIKSEDKYGNYIGDTFEFKDGEPNAIFGTLWGIGARQGAPQAIEVEFGLYIWNSIFQKDELVDVIAVQFEHVDQCIFGGVKVNIGPTQAVDAGAKWKLVTESIWRDSGTLLNLLPGQYEVEFAEISGWNSPAIIPVTIQANNIVQINASYSPIIIMGTLLVDIFPPEALTSGAKWKLTVETVWHDSGETISLAPGSYTVRFKTLEGWIMPANANVTINPGQLTQISGTYTGIPIINKMPDSLSPVCAAGTNAPGEKIYLYNGGNGTLNYTITDGGCAWLQCSPTSGSSTGETDMIDVAYSTSGLAAGPYSATITISDPNASNNPQTIPVNLTINPVKTLSSIAIEGPNQVNENSTQDFNCRAYYSDSTNALVEPMWGENSAYASISGSGLLTTAEVPSDQGCQITASYTEGGVTKNATLAVTIKDVPPETPSISSLVPDQGEASTPVTINGSNFGATQGTVTFNGVSAAITYWSATQIQTTVPSGATTGPVVARTSGGVNSNGVTFTVTTQTAPEIKIKYGGTALPSGGFYNFGILQAGATADVTFTIQNNGTADLLLSGDPKVALSGSGADQFSVTQQPSSPVAPAGSTTFIVRFAPTSAGDKSAVLSIANNDSDENPYIINLSGEGQSSSGSFCDDFEDGDLAGWTILDGDVTASAENPKNGSYSARLYDGSTGGAAAMNYSLSNANNSLVLEFWEWTNNFSAGTYYLLSDSPVWGSGWGLLFGANTNTQGYWRYSSNTNKADWVTSNPWTTWDVDFPVAVAGEASSWHKFRIEIDGPEGKVRFWYDDQFKGEASVTPLTQPIIYFEHGISYNAPTGVLNYLDDVCFGELSAPIPAIESLVPDQGAVGTTVTINGSNFGAAQGTVTFNGTSAAITTWGDTQIQTEVPSGATTGPVVVTTSGSQASNGVAFTVLASGSPEINVRQGTESIASGGSISFGTHAAGSDNDVTFTLENSGTADLVLSGTPKVAISGANADQFSVFLQPSSPIAAGLTTEFVVRFSPTSSGVKSATLAIASNDGDENPYVMNLSGTGGAVDSLIKIVYGAETGINVLTLNQDYSVNSKVHLVDAPAFEPIWSRDGQKIAYRIDGHTIWTTNADGSNQAHAVTSSQYCGPFEWGIDPDILYIGNSYAGDGEAAQLRLSTGEITQLTSVVGQNTQSYDLNADQTKIAYVRGTEGNGWSNVLYYANFAFESSDFTNKALLPDALPSPHEPRFSPSGTRILFLACTSAATGLGLINTDGTGFSTPVPLVSGEHVYYADWIDEDRIVYLLSTATGRRMYALDLQTLAATPIDDSTDANGKLQVYIAPGAAASLKLVSPNGGESWAAGESWNITWNSSGNITGVNIDYSVNGGATWLPLASNTANDGSYEWLVPNMPALNCLVRVSDSDGDPVDTSDAVFIITGSGGASAISGTILYNSDPLSGVVLSGLPGNPVTDGSGFYTSAVDYDWSGTVTPTLAGYAFTPTSRTYSNVTSDQTGQDYTAALAPSLQLTSPNGWEHWTLGSTKTITWNAVNYTGTVRLVLFKAGVRFGNIVANIPATNGTYTWTVGQTYDSGMAPEGSDYRLYLRSTDNTIIDPSDQRLGLIDPAQLEVTSPNGGESWELGTTQNITWNANGYAGTVRLVLFQKGTKIGQIVTSLPADQGSYAWTVGTHQAGTAPAGIKYSIRLMASDGSQDDFSDGPMTLTESDALIVDHQHTTLSTIPSQWLDQASREKLLVLGAQGNDAMALGLRLLGDRDARLATASNANSLGLVLNEGSWLPQGENLQLQEWQWALEKAILDSQATVVIVRPDEHALLAGKLNAESYLYVLNELSGRLPNVKLVCSTVSMEEANATLARFNRQVRESVLMNKGVLFDAADIESWRGDEQHMVNETPVRHPAYRGQGLMGEENLGRQGAAAWWLLARLSGWLGSPVLLME